MISRTSPTVTSRRSHTMFMTSSWSADNADRCFFAITFRSRPETAYYSWHFAYTGRHCQRESWNGGKIRRQQFDKVVHRAAAIDDGQHRPSIRFPEMDIMKR